VALGVGHATRLMAPGYLQQRQSRMPRGCCRALQAAYLSLPLPCWAGMRLYFCLYRSPLLSGCWVSARAGQTRRRVRRCLSACRAQDYRAAAAACCRGQRGFVSGLLLYRPAPAVKTCNSAYLAAQ